MPNLHVVDVILALITVLVPDNVVSRVSETRLHRKSPQPQQEDSEASPSQTRSKAYTKKQPHITSGKRDNESQNFQ
ncbi:hypothetical protein J6590_085100 [Homalodisca vitripennis]|nr:hypothetical protein J6590_085100 [Homalodisca vitripennis]